MTTDQPRFDSSSALAAPIPDDAPVMMATLLMAAASLSGQELLVGVAQLRQLGQAAGAGRRDRLPGRDLDADLVVALELGLGAARPQDHAVAAAELEHQDIRRRQPALAAR